PFYATAAETTYVPPSPPAASAPPLKSAPAAPTAEPTTTPAPTAIPESSDGPDEDQTFTEFREELLDAIVSRDYDALTDYVDDPFVIAVYQSQGVEISPPAEAVTTLREGILPPDAFITFELGADTTGYLGGQDPLGLWAANAVAAIPFQGWGPAGETDVMVIIARENDGSYVWHAVLQVPQGFADPGAAPTATPTAETTAEPTITATATEVDLGAYNEALATFIDDVTDLVERQDFSTLQSLMGTAFTVVGEPDQLTPAEATALLQERSTPDLAVGETGRLDYETDTWDEDFSDLLGYEVETCCGAGIVIAGALRTAGWQDDEEIMLLIRQTGQPEFELYGLIELTEE
ncbi:MAG: hypothetical protein GYB64_02105, partial [Chloroflexi bacterium]|nr:hypothetical protein [Chloroflexota bacterium]